MMIAGGIGIGVGVSLVVLGGVLLARAKRLTDQLRRRRRHSPASQFSRRLEGNFDLLAAALIVLGLAVALLGGLKLANDAEGRKPVSANAQRLPHD